MIIPIDFLKREPILSETFPFDKFPIEISTLDLIKLYSSDTEMLHYIRQKFYLTEEEKEVYNQLTGVVNIANVHFSSQIENSEIVYNSTEVNQSKEIFNSTDVQNSSLVVAGNTVQNSTQIFLSSFIFNCKKIINSTTITESQSIVEGYFTNFSKNIYRSQNISNSSEVFDSKNIEDSYFCTNCNNIKHCMFCENLTDSEYCLFNKPVDPQIFEIIKKQYKNLLDVYLKFTSGWPVTLNTPEVPVIDRVWVRYYETIPEKFWKWVRTLPEYTSEFMFHLTIREHEK